MALTMLFPTLLLFSLQVLQADAFTFWFTSTPTQCQNMTVQWSGGTPPFTLLLVPTGYLNPETRTIIQLNVPTGNSVSFVLDYPAKSQFVAVLSDASGIGSGGTSVVTTVADASVTNCLNTNPTTPKFFLYLTPEDVGQCDEMDISWQSNAEEPVDILALIPGGQSFEIANTTDGSTSFNWQANIRQGQEVMLVAGDKDGLGSGGSTDVMQVEGGDDSCISDNSPSSTAGPAAGGVSTASSPQQSSGSTGSTASLPSSGSGSAGSGGSTALVSSQSSSPGAAGQGQVSGGATGSSADRPTTTGGGAHGGSSGGQSGQTGSLTGHGQSTTVPGSSGGTVTGSPLQPNSHRNSLALILGLVIGILFFLAVIFCGIVYYMRRNTSRYTNVDTGAIGRPATRWNPSRILGAHIRGGAGSSVETLGSMYQTEPFIIPGSADHPHSLSFPQRPSLAAHFSSARTMSTLVNHPSYIQDALGAVAVGDQAPPPSAVPSSSEDKEGSFVPQALNRSLSGRPLPIPPSAVLPPITTDPPIRRTRDSEDFSPDAEEASSNPFGDEFVEIPPSYESVREVTRRRASTSESVGEGASLIRSNALVDQRRPARSTSGHTSANNL